MKIMYDELTGKPIDGLSDMLPDSSDNEFCDHCGTILIYRCLVCGAPVCCPKCCSETNHI